MQERLDASAESSVTIETRVDARRFIFEWER